MKNFLLIIFIFFAFTVFAPVGLAQRFASCDLCGYCPPSQPPSSWEKCRDCIYPDASSDPTTKETLKVNDLNNIAPTPYPGRQYTMIGCIKTGGFSSPGAAGGVVQILLNIIFSIVGGIALLYLIYGSFVILTSQAEPERLNYGKRLVYGAIVGVIFTLTSVFIVNFVTSGILKIPGF